MNGILASLYGRKSVRAFTGKEVPEETVNLIIDAAIQAPSAGNQQLYTILDIRDQAIKDRLAVLCDHQPFIAKAPLVFVLLADTRRWRDCYGFAGIDARGAGPGDLLLAFADAVIAAQNMVVAAESLGLGSCYIGDILEQREEVTALLSLDAAVVPAAMLVMGWPEASQLRREKPPRPQKKYLVLRDRFRPRAEAELRAMFREQYPAENFDSFMKDFCARKYESDFAREMNRSGAEYLKYFPERPADRRTDPARQPSGQRQ
jgi:nitroreductase